MIDSEFTIFPTKRKKKPLPAEKPCKTCGEVKGISEFYSQHGAHKRVDGSCKVCRRAQMVEYHRKRRMADKNWRKSKFTPKHYNCPVVVVETGLKCYHPVKGVKVGDTFGSIAKAELFTGIAKTQISAQLNGRARAARGVKFAWIEAPSNVNK